MPGGKLCGSAFEVVVCGIHAAQHFEAVDGRKAPQVLAYAAFAYRVGKPAQPVAALRGFYAVALVFQLFYALPDSGPREPQALRDGASGYVF